jgi:hypothetical protein
MSIGSFLLQQFYFGMSLLFGYSLLQVATIRINDTRLVNNTSYNGNFVINLNEYSLSIMTWKTLKAKSIWLQYG